MEENTYGTDVKTAEGDMPLKIPAEEYRRLVLAEAKLEGLKQLFDLDSDMFKYLTGKILGILEDEE